MQEKPEVVLVRQIIEKLREYIAQGPCDLGDEKSVLTMLYEAYSDCNRMDDDQIKVDFNELYRLMNGMELQAMDKIIYPVCTLCRDHERAGFVNSVKIGFLLLEEVNRI